MLRGVRGLTVALAALALAPAAAAAPPLVTASAAPAQGVAPLRVTLTAGGDAASYTWTLGDGTTAAGAVVSHVFGAGRHVVVVTATNEAGESSQAEVVVQAVARTVTLAAPAAGAHGTPATLIGRVSPAVAGGRVQLYRGRTHVTSAPLAADGSFRTRIRLAGPGPYTARYGAARSPERAIRVEPRLVTEVPAAVAVGGTGTVRARLVPALAGTVRIRVLDGARIVAQRSAAGAASVRIPSGTARTFRVVVDTTARPGWRAPRRTLQAHVALPELRHGSTGPSVLALERRLRELRYALPRVDATFGRDTAEAVIAFQKVHGLPRTGRVDATVWRRLAQATVPRPRYGGGDHIEVDKTRNVLYEILDGEVRHILHVSTGRTGNTPVGSYRVYRKVPGWDWVLWYPLYFLRGFAIHGAVDVPTVPASAGCVRTPLWFAPGLYARHGHGTRIVVFT